MNYQVGLALVVEGEIVLGVMGCPNWQDGDSNIYVNEIEGRENTFARSGIIMISHVGCGTWRTRLWDPQSINSRTADNWTRCLVDGFHQVHEARFCIPESQTWDSLPLSTKFSATIDVNRVGEKQILLLPTCCGRFSLVMKKLPCIALLYAYALSFYMFLTLQYILYLFHHMLNIIFTHIWEGSFFKSDRTRLIRLRYIQSYSEEWNNYEKYSYNYFDNEYVEVSHVTLQYINNWMNMKLPIDFHHL